MTLYFNKCPSWLIIMNSAHLKRIVILLLMSIINGSMFAQTFTLHGKVCDEGDNPLEFATVAVVSQGNITFTNLRGEYSIQLSTADSVAVRFSMVGYQAKTHVLRKHAT